MNIPFICFYFMLFSFVDLTHFYMYKKAGAVEDKSFNGEGLTTLLVAFQDVPLPFMISEVYLYVSYF